MASYPDRISEFTAKRDYIDDIEAADVNALQDEVVAIQTELGAGGVKGDYASLAARLESSDRAHPFDFPFAGKMRAVKVEAEFLGGLDEYTIADLSGDGIVRNIFIAADGGGTAQPYTRLQIFVDGELTPSVDAPLFTLFALTEIEDSGRAYVPLDTDYFTMFQWSTAHQMFGISLRWPVPYSSGCVIKLIEEVGTTFRFWTTVTYQDQLPACWNSEYRLKGGARDSAGLLSALIPGAGTISVTAGNLSEVIGAGTSFLTDFAGPLASGKSLWIPSVGMDGDGEAREVIAVSDDTHLTVHAPYSDPHTGKGYKICANSVLLDLPAGSEGVVAAVMCSFTPVSLEVPLALENNPHFHIDGETGRTLEWSGCEDYFGGCFYFKDFTVLHRGRWAGASWIDPTLLAFGGYHVHAQDPVMFTNGIKLHYPSEFNNAVNNSIWPCVLYYLKS